MSQQGEKPTGHEDAWWGELYDDSTEDTGPAPAADSLDDRFASAAGTLGDGTGTDQEAAPDGEFGPKRGFDPGPDQAPGTGSVPRPGAAPGTVPAAGTVPETGRDRGWIPGPGSPAAPVPGSGAAPGPGSEWGPAPGRGSGTTQPSDSFDDEAPAPYPGRRTSGAPDVPRPVTGEESPGVPGQAPSGRDRPSPSPASPTSSSASGEADEQAAPYPGRRAPGAPDVPRPEAGEQPPAVPGPAPAAWDRPSASSTEWDGTPAPGAWTGATPRGEAARPGRWERGPGTGPDPAGTAYPERDAHPEADRPTRGGLGQRPGFWDTPPAGPATPAPFPPGPTPPGFTPQTSHPDAHAEAASGRVPGSRIPADAPPPPVDAPPKPTSAPGLPSAAEPAGPAGGPGSAGPAPAGPPPAGPPRTGPGRADETPTASAPTGPGPAGPAFGGRPPAGSPPAGLSPCGPAPAGPSPSGPASAGPPPAGPPAGPGAVESAPAGSGDRPAPGDRGRSGSVPAGLPPAGSAPAGPGPAGPEPTGPVPAGQGPARPALAGPNPSGPHPGGAAPAGQAANEPVPAAPTGLPRTTGGFRTPGVAAESEDVRAGASREPVLSVPQQPPAVGHVGSGPPTYDAEPTALPPADPDALDDLVADTVLDGARYGTSTLRAVSVRGDSARYRGEPRRDALLTARFGAGEQALLLVAMATGARATPGAHRAAAEACRWIARAVGRSHDRLADDIRAARRGDLKSGLHRLTDRSLGKLRASAAEQGVEPEEYTASLRCLLLPADPECRTRVFFGVGAGGLFRLRDGEWQDIEPRVAEATGEPVVGFGSPPHETPEGDRLTMDLGITTPPSPYEPAPRPPRPPFRFRASIARPGDTLLLCTGGMAEPLRGEPELAEYLTTRWSEGGPPGLAAFLADSQVRVKGYADDRTAAAVWEA
ncbi:protein phosphatase 2C domain-containing protein [Streptomyces sp. NBC_00715]